MKLTKTQNIILVSIFSTLVLVAFLEQSFGIINLDKTEENRALKEKPKLDINQLDLYPKEYELYYTDNFKLKSLYINFIKWLSNDVFKKSTQKGHFFIGKDNWVFEKRNNLPIFLGKKTFNDVQIEKLITELTLRQEYLNSRDIKAYFLICPGKLSVETDKLPAFLQKGNYEITDQFINALNKVDIPYIDGRKSLKSRKNEHIIYYKYDTHWNELGAFFAFQDLMELIKQDITINLSSKLSDFNVDTVLSQGGNLRHVLGKNYTDPQIEYKISFGNDSINKAKGVIHSKTEDFPYNQDSYFQRLSSSRSDTSMPKAIIIRDSYAQHSKKFAPLYFSETIYLWDNWMYMLNEEIIEIEKPDIIIYMVFEGFLDRLLLQPSFVDPEEINTELQ